MKKTILLLLPVASFLFINSKVIHPEADIGRFSSDHSSSYQLLGDNFSVDNRGKVITEKRFTDIYEEDLFVDAQKALPELSPKLLPILEQQKRLLKLRNQKQVQKIGNLNIRLDDINKTIDIIQKSIHKGDYNLANDLQAYQIAGQDGKGNVKFTGYFTPILDVRKEKDSLYKYPLYSMPDRSDFKNRLPSRREIDGEKILSGKGLELAYAKNLVDIYFMQVQGSGIVRYPDGKQELFAFQGSNGHRYQSIGEYMLENELTSPDKVSLRSIRKFFDKNQDKLEEVLYSNPSYVFFTPINAKPTGAGHVPLSEEYSIAVDPKYIPVGSVLLASVPIVNNKHKLLRHEYKIVVAQDVGGAIKGKGHVDLYKGIGHKAQRKASALHHYGSLWLLLPKSDIITP